MHQSLFGEAVAAGLMPEEPLDVKEEVVVEEKPRQSEDVQHAELIKACHTLILRGNPGDFTNTSGLPRAASVKKLVDFKFTAQDVKRAFEVAMHEVETNGDDGKEHSEPGSGAAE